MKTAAKFLLGGAALVAAGAAPAMAADIYEPPVIETPYYAPPEQVPAPVAGWYLRGDVGYAWHKFHEGYYAVADDYDLVTKSIFGSSFRGSYSIGGGVGYKATDYFRTDLTLDYWGNGEYTGETFGICNFGNGDVSCSSTDIATFTALTLMANAYVDFGTYGRFTPYVGGGIGGSYVRWGELENKACNDADSDECYYGYHEGASGWRFAYAVMAGVSVDVSCNVAADVGYKFQHIYGGSMFGTYDGAGFGHDGGISSHQVKAGLRYKFGSCSEPAPPVYIPPEPLPVYK